MPMTFRPLAPHIAAEVDGIDVTKPLCDADVAAIHAGMDHYAVLVIRQQPMTGDQQLAFSHSLGPLEESKGTSLRAPEEYRLPTVFTDVSNLDKQNNG